MLRIVSIDLLASLSDEIATGRMARRSSTVTLFKLISLGTEAISYTHATVDANFIVPRSKDTVIDVG